MKASAASPFRWSTITEVCRRPYPLGARTLIPLVILMAMVPCYIFIGGWWNLGRPLHAPESALDRAWPLQPAWTIIYGSHLIFITLPFWIMRQETQIRRTLHAYLLAWGTAYLFFLFYPTVGPARDQVQGSGFFAWMLRWIYQCDTKYNCFPSLHVAHAFISALTCRLVHRGVGQVLIGWSVLIGLSTLFTKQHYLADVLTGFLLGYVCYVIFLRSFPRDAIGEPERRAAPVVLLGFIILHVVVVIGFWIGYKVHGEA